VGYADLQAAITDTGLIEGEQDEQIGRLAQLDDEIATLIDLKCGRSFGGTVTAAARVVNLPPSWGNAVLVLPFSVRAITSIVITGDYAETLDPTDYVLTFGTELTGDYHGIRRVDGYAWPANTGRSVLTITGDWSNAASGDVPDAIVAAATFLVVEEWRLRASSPAGEIGPDGMTVRPRNPWNFEIVRTALAHYGAALSMAGF
jgi:hypothetical protein